MSAPWGQGLCLKPCLVLRTSCRIYVYLHCRCFSLIPISQRRKQTQWGEPKGGRPTRSRPGFESCLWRIWLLHQLLALPLGELGSLGPFCVVSGPPGWAALCRNSLLMFPATPVSRHPLAQIIPSMERDVSESKGLGKQSSSPALATDSKDTEPLQASVYSLVNQRGWTWHTRWQSTGQWLSM